MAQPLVRELLRREIETLPEDLAQEILDFLLFVRARRSEEAQLWAAVEAAKEHRRQHPASVQTVTPDEWDRLTEHLDEVP
jgi:hypothetical protein